MARVDPARAAFTVRCAIYTRKSSDEGLEQEFNSLDAQREACEAYIVSQRSAVDDHDLAAGLVGLHDAMRLVDFLEARRLGPEPALRHLPRDVLERHVGQRETRRAEHEAAEEGEIDAARHLQERIEILDRREPAQPAGEARAAAATQHGEGIEDGAVADKIEHRVELLGLGDALGQVRPFQFELARRPTPPAWRSASRCAWSR